MSQRFLVFLMLASLFLARGLHASDFYYTKRVSIPEGLSQPNVTCIQTDSKGAVWIGTRYGLNAFRAGSIHHYLDKGGSNPPVSGNFVNCVFEDSAHRLWVGTTTALSLLDRKSDSFTRKLSHPVYAIAEIDGKIYFGGRGHMSRYNPSTGSFEEILINDGAARRDIIVYMCPIRPGIIFIALKHGTTMWLDTASFRVVSSTVVHRADCIFLTGCRTSSGRIYLSAYREGLVEVSPKGRIVKTWSPENSRLTNNIILALSEIEGRLWMATDGGGICLLDEHTRRVSSLRDIAAYRHLDLPGSSFTALSHDGRKTIWIGSVRHGAIAMKRAPIKQYGAVPLGRDNGLSQATVLGFVSNAEGNLWIGTDGGGVNFYNTRTDVFTHFRRTYGLKISSLCNFDAGHLLLSVYCRGLMLFDKRSGDVRPFLLLDKQTNDYENHSGYSPMLFYAPENKVFIFGEKPYVYNLDARRFEFLHGCENRDLSEMKIFGRYRGSYLVYGKHAVFSIDVRTNVLHCLYEHASDEINTAALLDGRIWMGTNSGAIVFDLQTGRDSHHVSPLYRRVTQMVAVGGHNLWIAADNGLFCYSGRRGKCRIIDESDGFSPDELIASDGTMPSRPDVLYFGGIRGLTRIDLRRTSATDEASRPELFNAMLDGAKVTLADGMRLTAPWNYSSVVIRVTLNGDNAFRKILYKYIIKGQTTSVIQSYSNELSLPKLQADTYDILVSYLMKDGRWSRPARIMELHVRQAWYRSPWLYLFLLLLASLLCLRHYRRLRSKANTLEEREKERLRIISLGDPANISGGGLSVSDEQFMMRFQKIVRENLSNPSFSVHDIYTRMAVSRSAFYSKFTAITGIGVKEYVNKMKMQQACRYLRTTDMPISQISDLTGFSTPHYFSNSFKHFMNVTPREYRARHASDDDTQA